MQPSFVQPSASRSARPHSSASLDPELRGKRNPPRLASPLSRARFPGLRFTSIVRESFPIHFRGCCFTLRMVGFRLKFAIPTTPRPEGPHNPEPEPKPKVMAAGSFLSWGAAEKVNAPGSFDAV